jgi:trypsin
LPESLSIRAGSNRIDAGGEVIAVGAIYRHPNFDISTKNFDVAALRLAQPILLDGITKNWIGLPAGLYRPVAAGDRVFVTGWGNRNNYATARYLRGINIPIVSQQTCKAIFTETQDVITPQMVCAGEPGKNVCLVRKVFDSKIFLCFCFLIFRKIPVS